MASKKLVRKASQPSLKSQGAGYSTTNSKGQTTFYKSAKDAPGYNDTTQSRADMSKGTPISQFDSAGKAITPGSMTNPGVMSIPTAPKPTSIDVTANNVGLSGFDTGFTTQGNQLTVAPTNEEDKYAGIIRNQNYFQDEASKLINDRQTGADIQRKLERDTGIQEFRQKQNNLSAQLNTITANRDANLLKVEGQGRGITDVIIGGQQAQINKEAAIQALPVQALLAEAQGNVALAEAHINTWGKILMEDATNDYTFKKELLTSSRDFANSIQLKRLEDLDKKTERAYQEKQTLITAKTSALSKALGQGAPASVSSAIQSATTPEQIVAALGRYNGDLLAQEAQRASIANSYDAINQRAEQNKVLLGTVNGKAQTEGEKLTQVFATRMLEANSIIDSIGGQFTGAKSRLAEYIPNELLSENRQKFDQAQRNFINAVLRKESGAVISPEEFTSAKLQYFPQPGDSTGTLEQKKQNRNTAISGLYNAANVPMPELVSVDSTTPLKSGFKGVTTSGLEFTIE